MRAADETGLTRDRPVLSRSEIDQFIELGYLRVEQAIPGAVAQQCCHLAMELLEIPASAPWPEPVVRGVVDGEPFHQAAKAPRLLEAVDQLLEGEGWQTRPNLGLLVNRSHHAIPPLLRPFGDDGVMGLSAPLPDPEGPVALATGLAGDVYLCHPFLVHAASWPHRGAQPRLIAQPPIALEGALRLEDGGRQLSPVALTVRRALDT